MNYILSNYKTYQCEMCIYISIIYQKSWPIKTNTIIYLLFIYIYISLFFILKAIVPFEKAKFFSLSVSALINVW